MCNYFHLRNDIIHLAGHATGNPFHCILYHTLFFSPTPLFFSGTDPMKLFSKLQKLTGNVGRKDTIKNAIKKKIIYANTASKQIQKVSSARNSRNWSG